MIFEPIDVSGKDNVVDLPVKFKEQKPNAPIFEVYQPGKCYHRAGYIFDDSLEHVKCNACNENLSPMYVLRQLANQESQWRQASDRYQGEMQRLGERSRTKCEHCDKMTRISR